MRPLVITFAVAAIGLAGVATPSLAQQGPGGPGCAPGQTCQQQQRANPGQPQGQRADAPGRNASRPQAAGQQGNRPGPGRDGPPPRMGQGNGGPGQGQGPGPNNGQQPPRMGQGQGNGPGPNFNGGPTGRAPAIGDRIRGGQPFQRANNSRFPPPPHGQEYRVVRGNLVLIDTDTLAVVAVLGVLSQLLR